MSNGSGKGKVQAKAASRSWFTAVEISRALKCCKKRIHRQASRERWPMRRCLNRYEYQVPRPVLTAIRQSPGVPGATAKPPISRDIPIAIPGPGPRLARMQMREQSVLYVEALQRDGMSLERALHKAGKAFSFSASATSIRRWLEAYKRGGFMALNENKLGRVGRKPKSKARGKRRD